MRNDTGGPAHPTEILRFLGVLHRVARRQVHASAQGAELPAVAWLLLNMIQEQPGLTLSALARSAGLSKSRASVVVDRLVSLGVVSKEADPADQRLVRLHPTGRMPEPWQRVRSASQAAAAQLLAVLDPGERAALESALRKMCDAAEAQGW